VFGPTGGFCCSLGSHSWGSGAASLTSDTNMAPILPTKNLLGDFGV
jgi:hypothetical protein